MNRFYGEFDYAHLPGKRPEGDYRSPFQIDRDRVLFSAPFRQLQSKTQVFQSGEYDFYRTRLTHTIEVARIGRSIAEYLNHTSDRLRPDFQIDSDLVEGIGLAHDIGHPPFGHIGERKLNELMAAHGGFEGNAQTLRILTDLIYPRTRRPSGMKPTRAFLDGIMKYKALRAERFKSEVGGHPPHNHFLYDEQDPFRAFIFGDEQPPPLSPEAFNSLKSLECQIMDWADDTAYSLHDIVDGVQARFITPESLRNWADGQEDLTSYQRNILEEMLDEIRRGGFEPRVSMRIGQFIHACSLVPCESPLSEKTNRHRFRLEVDRKVSEVCDLHKRIATDLIFRSASLQQIEFKGGFVLERLFTAYSENCLPNARRRLRILPEPYATWVDLAESDGQRVRYLCDFLSNMTDAQAIRAYKRLYDADFGSVMDPFA